MTVGTPTLPVTLPNYLHVGQGRAGSTSIHEALFRHPEIYLVGQKEAHFFNTESLYEQGLEAYSRLFFSTYGGQKIIGDLTPAYHIPRYMDRIVKDLGYNLKISICFRHPVARCYSHYLFEMGTRQKLPSFEQSLIDNPIYVEASLGGASMQNIYHHFPRANVLPLIFERDIRDSNALGQKLCAFLEVDPAKLLKGTKSGGKGFIPNITIANGSGWLIDYSGAKRYKAGDIVIETMRQSRFYQAQVIQNPDRDTQRYYRDFYDNLTLNLDRDTIERVQKKYFSDDIKRLQDQLQDDLPEWDIDKLDIKAPERVSSRLTKAKAGF